MNKNKFCFGRVFVLLALVLLWRCSPPPAPVAAPGADSTADPILGTWAWTNIKPGVEMLFPRNDTLVVNILHGVYHVTVLGYPKGNYSGYDKFIATKGKDFLVNEFFQDTLFLKGNTLTYGKKVFINTGLTNFTPCDPVAAAKLKERVSPLVE